MPNDAIKTRVSTIIEATLAIIAKSRPENTPINQGCVVHFCHFLTNAAEREVLTPIDICIALSYIEFIFQKLEEKRTSLVSTEWIKNYDSSTCFHSTDEILCVIAMILAVKGTVGHDIPYNNVSFAMLYCKDLSSNHPHSKVNLSLEFINRHEFAVLELLDYCLPRNGSLINKYARDIFIPDPLPTTNSATASSAPENPMIKYTMFANHAFPPEIQYARFQSGPDCNPHPRPQTIKDLLPAQFANIQPADDPTDQTASATQRPVSFSSIIQQTKNDNAQAGTGQKHACDP